MKIFVGNLSTYASEQDLKKLFSAFGDVISVTITYDLMNHRSRGMATVAMDTEAAGFSAIRRLHNSVFMEKALVVKMAES